MFITFYKRLATLSIKTKAGQFLTGLCFVNQLTNQEKINLELYEKTVALRKIRRHARKTHTTGRGSHAGRLA